MNNDEKRYRAYIGKRLRLARSRTKYTQEMLAEKLAYYISELNVLHPFREGNGRTIREFIRELALKNGYILNLKKVNPKDFFNASVKSIVDTNDLEKLINICLEK